MAEYAPFLLLRDGPSRRLLPGSALPLIADDIVERMRSLRLLGIDPDLTGALAPALLAASQQEGSYLA